MKTDYLTPSIEVIELQLEGAMLTGSGEDLFSIPGYGSATTIG